MKRILIIGDSLTQFSTLNNGWGLALVSTYTNKADILFRGYSGYNTKWIRENIDIIKSKADVSIVFLGANDSVLPGFFQHVDINEYKDNLSFIIDMLDGEIILITPPPIDETLWSITCKEKGQEMNRSKEHLLKYVNVVRNLKEKVLDLSDCPAQFLSDGLHFNDDGQRWMFEKIISILKTTQVHPDIPTILPHYRHYTQINPK
jgi:lysophospholipase L1-like esterase